MRHPPLGLDRHHRRYWWNVGGLRSVVMVEDAEGSRLEALLDCQEHVAALLSSLNPKVHYYGAGLLVGVLGRAVCCTRKRHRSSHGEGLA